MPKESPFYSEIPVFLYFDKEPTDVTSAFGDVTIVGNKVMINNITLEDRYKESYTVKWKGGRVDVVFEHTDLLDSGLSDAVGEED